MRVAARSKRDIEAVTTGMARMGLRRSFDSDSFTQYLPNNTEAGYATQIDVTLYRQHFVVCLSITVLSNINQNTITIRYTKLQVLISPKDIVLLKIFARGCILSFCGLISKGRRENRRGLIFKLLIAVSKSALDVKTLEAVQSLNKTWCMSPPTTGTGFALAGGSTSRSRATASAICWGKENQQELMYSMTM